MDLDARAEGGRVVVVGLDDSDPAWRAAAYAVGLARRQAALLVVVHVLPLHTTALLGGVSWMLADSDRETAQRLRLRVATGLARTTEARSLAWEFHIVPGGDVVSGLAGIADRLRADTVVVGASRHPWHRWFGSPAARLLHTRRWPVVVVP